MMALYSGGNSRLIVKGGLMAMAKKKLFLFFILNFQFFFTLLSTESCAGQQLAEINYTATSFSIVRSITHAL